MKFVFDVYNEYTKGIIEITAKENLVGLITKINSKIGGIEL